MTIGLVYQVGDDYGIVAVYIGIANFRTVVPRVWVGTHHSSKFSYKVFHRWSGSNLNSEWPKLKA